MTRKVRTDYYYYIYDNDEEDMIWYSPSSDDKQKCNRNLLNCIEEARRILRRNPAADIDIALLPCAENTKTAPSSTSPSAPRTNSTWSKRKSERR